jgi:hypothetical protein
MALFKPIHGFYRFLMALGGSRFAVEKLIAICKSALITSDDEASRLDSQSAEILRLAVLRQVIKSSTA